MVFVINLKEGERMKVTCTRPKVINILLQKHTHILWIWFPPRLVPNSVMSYIATMCLTYGYTAKFMSPKEEITIEEHIQQERRNLKGRWRLMAEVDKAVRQQREKEAN